MIWFFLFILLFVIGIAGVALAYLQKQETDRYRMRFVSLAMHGIFDYLLGILLIVMPWLLNFAAGGAETWVPVVLGAGLILYSLFTDYDRGFVRWIPVPYHLALDGAGGLLLFVSPFLFGFSDVVMDPHMGMGLLEMALALVTRPKPLSADGVYSATSMEGQQE